jgi:hypothetical protein
VPRCNICKGSGIVYHCQDSRGEDTLTPSFGPISGNARSATGPESEEMPIRISTGNQLGSASRPMMTGPSVIGLMSTWSGVGRSGLNILPMPACRRLSSL